MSFTKTVFTGRPTCYILIGPPACGKSTWTAEHLKSAANETHVASTDNVLEALAKENGITYSEAHKTLFKVAEKQYKSDFLEAVSAGWDIVVDRTNMVASARKKMDAYLRSNSAANYRTVAVVFDYEMNELLRRLAAREAATGKHVPLAIVERMIASYDAPLADDYDLIRYVR